MQTWILSVIGIVFIGVIFEIILPEGKTNAFIKHVFSILLLYVIISPIPKLFNKKFNSNSTNAGNIDNNFIYSINLEKTKALENDLINTFNNAGIKGVSVVVNSDIFNENFKINKIYIDLVNVVLSNENSHINIKVELLKLVQSKVSIAKEDVVFYG